LVAFQHLTSAQICDSLRLARPRKRERLERVKGIEPSSSAWKAPGARAQSTDIPKK
jgi:hypothetical protein